MHTWIVNCFICVCPNSLQAEIYGSHYCVYIVNGKFIHTGCIVRLPSLACCLCNVTMRGNQLVAYMNVSCYSKPLVLISFCMLLYISQGHLHLVVFGVPKQVCVHVCVSVSVDCLCILLVCLSVCLFVCKHACTSRADLVGSSNFFACMLILL